MIEKKNKGITIISLIITLIVLMIISIVSIKILSNNGIITKAQKASELYKKYQDEEKDYLINEKYMENEKKEDNFFQKEYIAFDGTNYIDTGIKLFSAENIHKDFEISFDITRMSDVDYATPLNMKDNSTDAKEGFAVINRKTAYNNMMLQAQTTINKYQYKYIGEVSTINSNTINIKIIRRDGFLYYIINNGEEQNVIDLEDIDKPFDTTLTFGAAKWGGEIGYKDFFEGELRNIEVKLAEESKIIKTAKSYMYNGECNFNGSNRFNTGLKLFSEENINKDFDIEFEIKNIENSNTNQDTILNSLKEGTSPYPGFAVRISGTDNISIKANSTSSNKKEDPYPKNTVTKVKLKRRNKILYYSVNNGDEIQLLNYSDLAGPFDTPVTFGCSLNNSGNPQRYFKGKLANMKVQILD